MTSRFQIAPAARAEVTETFGEDFAISILGCFDARRGMYAPVCADAAGREFLDASRAQALFSDMLWEVR